VKGRHNPNQVRRVPQLSLGEHNWKPPPKGSLKLNFDGASKGNPGRTSMGGVIRDNQGRIIRFYTGSLGNSTNNVAKFGALETGLEILHREGIENVIVEGDSMLFINTLRKLQNKWEKYRGTGAWHTICRKFRSICR
jgi:ribonuclease HI